MLPNQIKRDNPIKSRNGECFTMYVSLDDGYDIRRYDPFLP